MQSITIREAITESHIATSDDAWFFVHPFPANGDEFTLNGKKCR
jgi:hypothetical protein